MPDEKKEVIEITCPQCERVWPAIAEQGVVTDMYGKCYHCFIHEVMEVRDALTTEASYSIGNCDDCGGVSPLREKCLVCFGKGWLAIDKPTVQ